MKPIYSHTKQRFGRLVAQKPVAHESAHVHWLCVCDCGKRCVVRGSCLRSGQTRSCGCLRGLPPRHGQRHTVEYHAWSAMRQRCLNPNAPQYKNYGGRGIRICKRWNKFENFIADMGKRPGAGYSIDRINNNGNYTPSNCRWTTWKVQQNNRRSRKKK